MHADTFFELWKDIRMVFDQTIEKHDNKWRTRSRLIDTRFLLLFILRLVIPKDERGYGCTLSEIFNHFLNFGIQDVPKKLAPSSVCEARQKLDPFIFQELNNCVIAAREKYIDQPSLWCGHRLYGVDGSKFNLPRELINAGYTTPGKHAHYPQALVSGVYDLLTGIPHDFELAKHHNERKCAANHLERYFRKGDISVYDRGYFSFELLQQHVKSDVYAIFRLATNTRYVEIEQFWNSDKVDEIVVLRPPKSIVEEVRKKKSEVDLTPITVRLIKYIMKETTYVLCVTLLDKVKYPTEVFPNVYHARWGFEEMLKVSKVITGVQDFHSKTEQGIAQELYAHFLLITLTKIIESQSHHEVKQEKSKKEPPKRRLRLLQAEKHYKKSEDRATLLTKDSTKKSSKTQNASPLTKKNVGEFKMNRKNCFLNICNILEKLFWWEPVKFFKIVLTNIVEASTRMYQKIRPGRSYERKSKRPINKWNNSKRKRIKINALC